MDGELRWSSTSEAASGVEEVVVEAESRCRGLESFKLRIKVRPLINLF